MMENETGNDTMAQHEEAYVKYNSAFPFSTCHPTGTPFKLMLHIRITLFSSTQCNSTFSANLFSIRVILLKMKNKKTNDVNATTTKRNTLSRVLRQILMYLNHLWVCLVFYKVLAIFNLLYSICKISPITQSYHAILSTGYQLDR